MFRLAWIHKDEESLLSSRRATNADDGRRSEAGPETGMKRKAYSGTLPRTVSARGWRATFMSI